jgi:rhodanese-related sulfurtransferase
MSEESMFQSLFGSNRVTTAPRVASLTVNELYDQLQETNDYVLLDVRTPGEYEYDGHIEGSRLLPLQMLGQRLNELPTDRPIVIVCRSGNRSHVACEQLTRIGFDNVINLSGGMIAWKMAGLPFK